MRRPIVQPVYPVRQEYSRPAPLAWQRRTLAELGSVLI